MFKYCRQDIQSEFNARLLTRIQIFILKWLEGHCLPSKKKNALRWKGKAGSKTFDFFLCHHHVWPSGGHRVFSVFDFSCLCWGNISLFCLYMGTSCKMLQDDSCFVQMYIAWIFQSVLLGKPVQNSHFHVQANLCLQCLLPFSYFSLYPG